MYGEVQSISRLSPTMVRVVLGGADLANFESTGNTDEYINAQFRPEGAPYEVPFDPEVLESIGSAHRPKPRRFTVRRWDEEKKLLTIDFVTHGDVGYAGRWAQNAQPGDRLQFKGPSGGYTPDPTADWYLYVGDESALPAISRSIESLAENAVCLTVIVVDGHGNELPIEGSAQTEIIWVHRNAATDPETVLLEAVTKLVFPPGKPDVFVHGEAGEVRAIRRHLATERSLNIDDASISPYWRRDHDDEGWRAIKKQWLADQAGDI